MHPDLKAKNRKGDDHKADRILGRVRGEGIDPRHITSTKNNPFLGRPQKAVKSSVMIRDGAKVQEDDLLPVLNKRIVRIVCERYDVTLHFADGSAMKICDGGEGLAYLVQVPEKKPNQKQE